MARRWLALVFLAEFLKCKAGLSVDRHISVLEASQQTLFRARRHQQYQLTAYFPYIALMLFFTTTRTPPHSSSRHQSFSIIHDHHAFSLTCIVKRKCETQRLGEVLRLLCDGRKDKAKDLMALLVLKRPVYKTTALI